MLVLSRKKNESIVIGTDIVIEVVEIRGDKVRLGIKAPKEVQVDRLEIRELKEQQKEQPSHAAASQAARYSPHKGANGVR